MERVRGIGGVFVRPRDKEALRRWYVDLLGIEAADFGGAVFRAAGGEETIWAIFDSDTSYFGSPAQQVMVNYRVDDLDAMLAQLRAGGADVDPRVQDDENGRFGWVTDPEGNRIELWQPSRRADSSG